MKRKFGGLLLALCMALCLLPSAAFAEDCNWRYGATDPENHSYTWKAADGQYWQECERCGAVTAKQALPALTIVGPDKVCRTQDYTFTFAVPEGCTQPGCGYEFPMICDEADVQL